MRAILFFDAKEVFECVGVPGELLEQFVLECILPAHPVFFADLQAPLDEISGKLANVSGENGLARVYSIDELYFVVGRPGSVPMQHLIINQPDRP